MCSLDSPRRSKTGKLLLRKKLKNYTAREKRRRISFNWNHLKKYFEKNIPFDRFDASFHSLSQKSPLSLSTFPRGLSLIRSLAKTGPSSMKNPPFPRKGSPRLSRYPYYPIHNRECPLARTCLPLYACLRDREYTNVHKYISMWSRN